VAFYSLQKGAPAAQAKDDGTGLAIIDIGDELRDFGDTAAAIMNLDLLITVDTAAAHVAGALGRQVWVLLPFAPDWRWLLGHDDCPWYPSMALKRQTHSGAWNAVVSRTVEHLSGAAASGAKSRR
jgi:hypothetical protein